MTGPPVARLRVGACAALAASALAVSLVAVTEAVPAATSGRVALTDPGEPGPHDVTTSNYRLAPAKIAGLRAKVDMLGHVVRPTDATDESPLVVLMHGQHQSCYDPGLGKLVADAPWPCPSGLRAVPSYRGYDYVQQVLASQGFVTVSISANGVNAQDFSTPDGGASARSALFAKHLKRWVGWIADGTYDADLDNLVLVGQGTAGEGADRLAAETRGADYDISGLVLLAPTAVGSQAAAHTPTATLLPYCDGLLPDLGGQAFTDVARDVTATPALHGSVLMLGANHNYFNTEWTPATATAPAFDDWFGPPAQTCGKNHPDRLSAAQQRAVGIAYIAGPVRYFTGVDPAAFELIDGSEPVVPSIGTAVVLSHAIGGGRSLRRPGIDASDGAGIALCTGSSGFDAPGGACGSGVDSVRAPHWPPTSALSVPRHDALEMSWSAISQTGAINFATPLDLSGAASLDLRTIVDPGIGNARLVVRLRDGPDTVPVTPRNNGLLTALPQGDFALSKLWAQTLRVPLAGVTGIDLAHITGITLVSDNAAGHVWVLDAAAVPAVPAAGPANPLPVVNIASVRRAEGNGTGVQQFEVPFTVTGNVTGSAQFVVAATFVKNNQVPEQVVTVAPGQHDGSITFPYRPNRRDGFDYSWLVRIYPRFGVMTGSYAANATVADDDRPPKLTVTRPHQAVTEGAAASFRLRISARADYPYVARMVPARGPRSLAPATVGDLTARLRRKLFGTHVPALATPLFKTNGFLLVEVSPQPAGTLVSLGTLRNPGNEPRKTLAFTFVPRNGGRSVTSAVTLRDS